MDDGFHVPLAVGVMAFLEHAYDTAIPSALLPFIQSVLHYRLKTLLEIERMHALPSWLCRDGAPMPWVGFKAQQVRHGVGPRRVATWQDEPEAGPISPDTLAQNIVKWQLRDLQGVCYGAIRALAKAGVVGAKVTGMMDGTDRSWRDHHGRCGVVPATATMAVTVDARVQAAAGEGIPLAAGCVRARMGKAESPRLNGWRPRSWA